VQADEVQADEVQVGEARGRALPGVEDHRQVFVVGGQCPVAGDELVDAHFFAATTSKANDQDHVRAEGPASGR
jgi:hypothetical protein